MRFSLWMWQLLLIILISGPFLLSKLRRNLAFPNRAIWTNLRTMDIQSKLQDTFYFSSFFPCMKSETLPAYFDSGKVIPLPIHTNHKERRLECRSKFPGSSIVSYPSPVQLSGHPKTGTSLLQHLLWEILIQNANYAMHLSPARIHRDFDCLQKNVNVLDEEFACLVSSIPRFDHAFATQCDGIPKIYTIRRIDDSIRSYCLWSEGSNCNLETYPYRKMAKGYINYYEKALNCSSNIPIRYSSLTQAIDGKEHEKREFFAYFSRALQTLGWNQIPYETFKRALAHSTIPFMSMLEHELSNGILKPKVNTGNIPMKWSHDQKKEMQNMGEVLVQRYPEFRSDITGV